MNEVLNKGSTEERVWNYNNYQFISKNDISNTKQVIKVKKIKLLEVFKEDSMELYEVRMDLLRELT